MSEVSYVDLDQIDWVVSPPKPNTPADNPKVRTKFMFDLAGPQVRAMFCEYEPGHWEHAHAHDRNEVLVVLAGSADIGEVHIEKGSAIHVPAGTVYGPITGGPDGLQFLRFDFPGNTAV